MTAIRTDGTGNAERLLRTRRSLPTVTVIPSLYLAATLSSFGASGLILIANGSIQCLWSAV